MKKYKDSCIRCQNDESLFELFHNETSLKNSNIHFFDTRIAWAFDDDQFMSKIYGNLQKDEINQNSIILKGSQASTDEFLSHVVKRKSVRSFSKKIIDFEVLSNILLYSFGRSDNGTYTVPSAGGTYPNKLILCINRVENLEPGIYEYNHTNGTLTPIFLSEELDCEKVTANSNLMSDSSFSIHLIGNPELICYKYQDQGYRFMNIECGHVAQNLTLVANRFNVVSVCSGGFLDGCFIEYLSFLTAGKFDNYMLLYEVFFGKEN